MQAELIVHRFQRKAMAGLSVALVFVLSAVACAADAPPDSAQIPAQPSAEAPKTPASVPPAGNAENSVHPVMDQRALDLLKRMSDSLAAARSYGYHTRSSMEIPASTGQFLTFFAQADLLVERPNKLRVRIGGDGPAYQITYDGSRVWAFDPAKNLYAVLDAPGSIEETLSLLVTKAGIHFPASNFMASDPYAVMTRDLSSAFVVGASNVNGAACDHLAFIGPGIDWEVWVESGKKEALPQRLAITYKDAADSPRYMVEFFDWNLKRKPAPTDFVFKAPKDARQIEFSGQPDSPQALANPGSAGEKK